MNLKSLKINKKYEIRKSICLESDLPFGFTLKAPKNIPSYFIDDFINKKRSWLNEIEKNFIENNVYLFPLNFQEMTHIMFLGKKYKTTHLLKNKTKIYFTENQLVIEKTKKETNESIKKKIILFIKKIAHDIIYDRLEHHCKSLNVDTPSLRLKMQKSRWGSCSSKKNININWLLIKTPLNILDYVILHECCHLIHMNHSKKFWDLVRSKMKNYNKQVDWLSQVGPILMANINIIKKK